MWGKEWQEALFHFSLHLWRYYKCRKADTFNYTSPIPEEKKRGGKKIYCNKAHDL